LDAATKSKNNLEKLRMQNEESKKIPLKEIFDSVKINLRENIHDESFRKY